MTLSVLICILSNLGSPYPGIVASWMLHHSETYPQVPIEVVIAVGYHESRLRHISRFNRTNDIGIMQINKIWESYCKAMFRKKGNKCKSIKTLSDNIRMGFHVLNLGRKKGNMIKYYNYGNPKYSKKVKKILKKVIDYKPICRKRILLRREKALLNIF